MLPLISNVLPQATASQASVAATSASFVAAQASAVSKPMTADAVTAANLAAPLPQLPPRKSEVAQRNVANSAVPQSDRPAILPDPEFWKVPNRPVGEQIAPLPSRQQLIDQVQQAVQYTAQAVAQETPEVPQERPQQVTNNLRRFNALLAKKPGVGNSQGHNAYHVAAQRSMQLHLPASVETTI